VQAQLQLGEVESHHWEGKEAYCQLHREDHWEGMVSHHRGKRRVEAWSLVGMEEDPQEGQPWLLEVACYREGMVDEGMGQVERHQSRWAVEQKQAALRGAADQKRSLLEVDHLHSRTLL